MRQMHGSCVAPAQQLWPNSTYLLVSEDAHRPHDEVGPFEEIGTLVMDPRTSKDAAAIFPMAGFSRQAEEVLAIRLAAARERDAAIAAGIRRAFGAIWQGVSIVAVAVVTWPERRRTYENLRALTDRELADIGLTRGDIGNIVRRQR
jgi:uncharacterized protein YjiS (DUF1127 family)